MTTQTERTCRKCGDTRPIEDFPFYKGEKLRRSACRTCHTAAAREWKRNNLHCNTCRRYRPRRMFYISADVESPTCSDCRNKPGGRGFHVDYDALREEYDFARTALGKTHEAAYLWVQEQFGCSVTPMNSAGLYISEERPAPDVPDDDTDPELFECRTCHKHKVSDDYGTSIVGGWAYRRLECKRCMADRAKAKRHSKAAAEGRTLRPRRTRET